MLTKKRIRKFRNAIVKVLSFFVVGSPNAHNFDRALLSAAVYFSAVLLSGIIKSVGFIDHLILGFPIYIMMILSGHALRYLLELFLKLKTILERIYENLPEDTTAVEKRKTNLMRLADDVIAEIVEDDEEEGDEGLKRKRIL